MQGQADHFLRRVRHGDPAVLESAGVLRLEQQVEAVDWHITQSLADGLDIHPQAKGAPGVRHCVKVARVGFGQFAQQVLVEVAVARQ
ncbi:hypothetical protein D9M71_807910 [compost metagenome]